jgi:hypothetical protein
MESVRMGTPRAAGSWFVGLASVALVGCSGGGGGSDDSPAESQLTSFAFVGSSSTSSEIGGAVSITVRLTTTEDALPEDVTVDVVDALSGSAIEGVDYAAFGTETLTFAAGAESGDTQTVQLTPLDDVDAEIDETVVLSLSAPSGTAQLGVNASYTLTVSDDDSGGPASFVASEGFSGVENSVAHNSTLDLGALPVGLGPNAGTKVRVTNAGGLPMALGAPRITGTNVNDFVVAIETAPLSGVEMILGGAEEAATPLVQRVDAEGPGVALRLDAARFAALPASDLLILHGFPAPGLGEVTLALQRRPLPFSSDAVLAIDGVVQPGGPAALVGDLAIWTGSVLELEGSRVFLTLSSSGAQGFVELPLSGDRYLHIVSEAPASAGAEPLVRVVREQELAALGFQGPPVCGAALEVPGAASEHLLSELPPPTSALTAADCRLAIETDYQLYQKFNSAPATTLYVTQLIAAVSDQYLLDVQTTLSIAYLGVYTNAGDPWTSQDSGGTASQLLDEFRAAWAPINWPAVANLAHFISGASLGGGVAYVNVLCNQSFGFGVSGNIHGLVDWDSWSGAPGSFTWDFVVVAHELGHNFGSGHTHSYCPPLDVCYSNCNGSTACSQGTIMSYCHTCGGMNAIDLEFHPVTANIMRGAVNASCLGRSELAAGDWVQYYVRFNPLTATGSRAATLEFPHDAANQPQPFRVQLVGVAE